MAFDNFGDDEDVLVNKPRHSFLIDLPTSKEHCEGRTVDLTAFIIRPAPATFIRVWTNNPNRLVVLERIVVYPVTDFTGEIEEGESA
jgi:hypothetical protein